MTTPTGSGPRRARRVSEAGVALPALAFGLPILVCGVWVVATVGLGPLMQWSASKDWIATPCRIVELKSSWNGDKTIATVVIRYTYRADGRAHEGTRYDFSNHRFDSDEFHGLADEFPPASDATCYVDPDDPTESVLTQNYNGHYTGGCVMGGILLLVGAALTWVGFRWRSESASLAANNMSGP